MSGLKSPEGEDSLLQQAEELTHTCYQMYNFTSTGLGPEVASMKTNEGSKTDMTVSVSTYVVLGSCSRAYTLCGFNSRPREFIYLSLANKTVRFDLKMAPVLIYTAGQHTREREGMRGIPWQRRTLPHVVLRGVSSLY